MFAHYPPSRNWGSAGCTVGIKAVKEEAGFSTFATDDPILVSSLTCISPKCKNVWDSALLLKDFVLMRVELMALVVRLSDTASL